MKSDHHRPPPEIPEWRRSGRFILLAIALHAAVLFYPANMTISSLETPPTAVTVELKPLPPPLAEPVKTHPPAVPVKTKQQEHRHPKALPVIAMPPEQAPAATPALATPQPTPVATLPAPPAAPPTSPPAVASISPARFDAAYLDNPRPNYPSISRRRGEEGKVLLRVLVSPDGLAATVNIEKSSNFERLDEAARQAISRWRFVPARRGDKNIEASVIVPFVFRLDN
jgi:periplasmic protein TonB